MTWVEYLLPVLLAIVIVVALVARDARRRNRDGRVLRDIFESEWSHRDDEGGAE